MLMFFACVGMAIGEWLSNNQALGAWLGMIAGLVFGIMVMMPICNETARWKIKKLFGVGEHKKDG